MKKYLLVSLTILFAAAFVWAEEAAPATPSVDVKADATLSWGIDLGKGDISGKNIKHGFKNETSFTVKFPLINKGNKVSAKRDVPVYGEVLVKDIELAFESKHDRDKKAFTPRGKVGSVKGKLFFYGAYLQVAGSPEFKSNFANLWDPLDTNGKFDEDDHTFKFEPGFEGAGAKLGYTNKNFMNLDVGVKLGSNGAWDAKDRKAGFTTPVLKYFDGNTAIKDDEYVLAAADFNDTTNPAITHTLAKWIAPPQGKVLYPKGYHYYMKRLDADPAKHSKYGIGVDFAIKPLDKMLAIALTVNSTFSSTYSSDHDFNIGAEVTSEPIADLTLKVGFDGGTKFVSGAKFDWDTIFTADYKWVGAGIYVTPKAWDTSLSVYGKFETKADKKDATNLVEGLNAGAYLGLYDLLKSHNGLPIALKVWGSYKVNLNDASWLKPAANVWLETNNTVAKGVALAYDVGVTYSPVEKVEVTGKWSHGSTRNNVYGSVLGNIIETPAGFGTANYHNGKFVLSLKLIY